MIFGRKKLFILFSVILMSILLSNVFAVTTFKPQYGITTSNVNFRTSPYGNKIKILKKNTYIKMVGLQDNFYIIQTPNNEVGYIHKNYVNKLNKNNTNAKTYTRYNNLNGYIKGNYVNVRIGPSTKYMKITSLKNNTNVTIIGKIDDFYVTFLKDKRVGLIKDDYLSLKFNSTDNNKPNSNSNSNSNSNNNDNTSTLTSSNEIINYINKKRNEKGLKSYEKNYKLIELTKLKATEMKDKNYFLHTSPTYGTPFKMMQNFGITYLSAGENIGINNTVKISIDNFIKSSTYSKNIFSTKFNNIGAYAIKNKNNDYIVDLMFIQK